MYSEKNINIQTIDNYQITYQELGDYLINITVHNIVSLVKYEKKNHKLTQVNFKGLDLALKGGKQFSIDFVQHQEKDSSSKLSFLQLRINYKSIFVFSVCEIIQIPFKSKTSDMELYRQKIKSLNKRRKQILQKENSQLQIAITPKDKDFKSDLRINENFGLFGDGDQGYGPDYQMVQFQNISIPDVGKYYVELTMLLKCKATYFYFYTNQNYQGIFPSGCMMLPSISDYVPVKFNFLIDNTTTHAKSQKLFVYDIVDYPIQAKNIIITLNKIK